MIASQPPSGEHKKECVCDTCKEMDEKEGVVEEAIVEENNENTTANTTSSDPSKESTLTEKDISLEEFDHLPKSLQNRLGALKLLKEKGNDLYRRNLFEEAVEEYAKVDRFMGVLFKKTETSPEEMTYVIPFQTACQLNIAQCLMKVGKYSKALDHLDTAEEYNKEYKDKPSEKKILFRRAKCYLDGIEVEKGKDLMKQVKEKYPEDPALIKLVDAELKKYKEQFKSDLQNSSFKGMFNKKELYDDMPEPVISVTPSPETNSETINAENDQTDTNEPLTEPTNNRLSTNEVSNETYAALAQLIGNNSTSYNFQLIVIFLFLAIVVATILTYILN
ncbi:predicted protein [Naegleria gruberi]|uniref:Predicted protein n=1 Tax=Naegleria gruberi TaxID=5762 RepID=D2VBJ7_NAEGR|nr:uncharacterized protein NAEGRDRAFT_48218 [Naegleria gruberi]EFC45810.1 predicted protein [Naegleria gruberi]|eukprot:XP_002678554.1 predicted protein [Naegleria gruberi strain NEG-M]